MKNFLGHVNYFFVKNGSFFIADKIIDQGSFSTLYRSLASIYKLPDISLAA
jgi:hypothetical protein